MVRHHGLEHPRGIVDHRVTKSVKVWTSPVKTYHDGLGEVCVTLAQGEYGEDCVSRTVCLLV